MLCLLFAKQLFSSISNFRAKSHLSWSKLDKIDAYRTSTVTKPKQMSIFTPFPQLALDASRYNHTLKFDPLQAIRHKNRPSSKQHPMYMYNPPFSKSMQTDIRKKFLTLVDNNIVYPTRTLSGKYSTATSYKDKLQQHKQHQAGNQQQSQQPEIGGLQL